MSTIQPDSYFDALEVQFNDLALAVATGDAETLPALSEQIQKTAVSLAGVWQQWQRQGVCRLDAATARQLHAGVFDQWRVKFSSVGKLDHPRRTIDLHQ